MHGGIFQSPLAKLLRQLVRTLCRLIKSVSIFLISENSYY